MFGFSRIIAVLTAIGASGPLAKVYACPYLKRRMDIENNHHVSNPHADGARVPHRHAQSGFFYGRLFTEEEVPTFNTSLVNLIEASRPDGSYMDEASRSTGGFLILPDGTTSVVTPGFKLRGAAEAASLYCVLFRYLFPSQSPPHNLN